jgi:hypothetical protein
MMRRIALVSVAAVVVLAVALFSWPLPTIEVHQRQRQPGSPVSDRVAASVKPVDDEFDAQLTVADQFVPSENQNGLEPVPLERNRIDSVPLRIDSQPQPATPSLSGQVEELANQPIRTLRARPAAAPASPKTDLFAHGRASKSRRNRDFPTTFIRRIHVDLTSPNHWVELTWSGPAASRQETGPFRSSPGAGLGGNDCDDLRECNRSGSNCTPKGMHAVEAFSDYLPSEPSCRYVTWFMLSREIALHSHRNVPRYPASHGCVRLDEHAAQLIHNNSLIGETEVLVDGTWNGSRN